MTSEIINDSDLITAKVMGNIVDLQWLQHMNLEARIKRLDKTHYLVVATGEVLEFSHSVKRSDNTKSLRKTFKRLRERINANFSGEANELFVTLTYDQKLGKRPYLTDKDYLRKTYQAFVRKIVSAYGDSVVFIKVTEPHGDGHAHMHVLIKFPDQLRAYVSNDQMREFWGLGNVIVRRLTGNTNVGAYLTAYLTDVELNDESLAELVASGRLGQSLELVEKSGKKFIKGGRLHYYPVDFHLFTCSRNAKFPVVVRTTKNSIKKELSAATLSFSKIYDYVSADFSNQVRVESYHF